MQFLRSGQDDRRRRMISDDASGASTPANSAAAPSKPARTGKPGGRNSKSGYGDAKFLDSQPRLTDLVPTRATTISLLLAAGVAAIAALLTLHLWMPAIAVGLGVDRIGAFDLDGGGIAGWFASTLLAGAGLVALVIYHVRRHRVDDYHARYRVWLWTSACWFLLSLDEGAGLHHAFRDVMTGLTGRSLLGDGSIWWVGAYGLLLGGMGVRLLFEMKPCRTSRLAMLGVAICFVTAIIAQLPWLLPASGLHSVLVEEGCELGGELLLLLAMVLHARYVILEANGILPAAPKKTTADDAKAKKAEAEPATLPKRSDLDPVAKPSSAPSRSPTYQEDDYEDEFDDRSNRKSGKPQRYRIDEADESYQGDRKLSKADRKAMRRQKERERRSELD